jgi:hypothetical protein
VPADLATHSAALVRRARAGDQNAMALILQVGKAAREGANARAKAAYAMLKRFIDKHPIGPGKAGLGNPGKGGLFGFGGDVPDVPSAPPAIVLSSPTVTMPPRPPLPRGSLDKIFDPDLFPLVVVRACRYQDGLAAAAVVLASGPALTPASIQEIGLSTFGSEETSASFFHGVKNCTDADLREVAQVFRDIYLRRPFVVGQCVGRAWRLQAVRRPGSRIGLYAPVAGWEFGEVYRGKPSPQMEARGSDEGWTAQQVQALERQAAAWGRR